MRTLRSYAGFKDGRSWGRLPFASVSTDDVRRFVNDLHDSPAGSTGARPVGDADLVDHGNARRRTPVQRYPLTSATCTDS